MIDLRESRKKIDEIDKEITKLFNERMRIAGEVADYKAATGKPVFDPIREEEKLTSIEALAENDFNKTALREIFSSIMSISRKYQYRKLSNKTVISGIKQFPPSDKIGFYGGIGSYIELAMKDFFGKDTNGYTYPSFKEICLSIEREEIEYGVLPIENSTTGSISDIYELLVAHRLHILAEKIANDIHNTTRFIVISKKETYFEGSDKINICFDIPHKIGSLYNLISNFIYNKVNMTSIESRTIPDQYRKYRFFVELDGNLNDENVINALHGIKSEADHFTILGNYISDSRK